MRFQLFLPLANLWRRYRAWRRAGQVWINGRRMSQIDVIEDVQKF